MAASSTEPILLVTKKRQREAKTEYVPSEIVAQRVLTCSPTVGRLESKMREIGKSIRDLESLANARAQTRNGWRASHGSESGSKHSAAIAGLH